MANELSEWTTSEDWSFRHWATRPIGLAIVLNAAALVLACAFFRMNPGADLATSMSFFSAHEFPVAASRAGRAARTGFIAITDGTVVLLAAILAVSVVWPFLQGVHRRAMVFAVVTYLMIPGILVNGIIKPLWGRARPMAISEFGGTLRFTSPFQLSEQCHKACSFLSGETSALFTSATLFCLLVIPVLRRNMRWPVMVAVGCLAMSGSILRIAFGAHFLSDIVFSAVISMLLTLAFFSVMRPLIDKATG